MPKKLNLPEEEICTKYQDGTTSTDLASEYGVSYPTVLRILKKNKIKIKPRGPKKTLKVYPMSPQLIKALEDIEANKGMSVLKPGEKYRPRCQ